MVHNHLVGAFHVSVHKGNPNTRAIDAAFAAKCKKNPRNLALARVREAEGSQVFSRSGVEPLIAILAQVGAFSWLDLLGKVSRQAKRNF